MLLDHSLHIVPQMVILAGHTVLAGHPSFYLSLCLKQVIRHQGLSSYPHYATDGPSIWAIIPFN